MDKLVGVPEQVGTMTGEKRIKRTSTSSLEHVRFQKLTGEPFQLGHCVSNHVSVRIVRENVLKWRRGGARVSERVLAMNKRRKVFTNKEEERKEKDNNRL